MKRSCKILLLKHDFKLLCCSRYMQTRTNINENECQANASELKVAMRKMQAAILRVKSSTYSRDEIHRLLRHQRIEINSETGAVKLGFPCESFHTRYEAQPTCES